MSHAEVVRIAWDAAIVVPVMVCACVLVGALAAWLEHSARRR